MQKLSGDLFGLLREVFVNGIEDQRDEAMACRNLQLFCSSCPRGENERGRGTGLARLAHPETLSLLRKRRSAVFQADRFGMGAQRAVSSRFFQSERGLYFPLSEDSHPVIPQTECAS